MKIHRVHSFASARSVERAEALQERLRKNVRITPLLKRPALAVGADCGYDDNRLRAFAGLVVLKLPSLEVVERVFIETSLDFPYTPGLLSFREAPPLLKAFKKLKSTPDIAFFDGSGIAHPRRFGLASHMGLFLGIPSVGVSKKRYVGTHNTPGKGFGSSAPLKDKGEVVGAVFRAGEGRTPVYVSPGHLIDVKGSLQWTRAVSDGGRIPLPTRLADHLVRERMSI